MRLLLVHPKLLLKNFPFFCAIYKKKMLNQSTKERKAKYNELSNDQNINNREKPIDLSIKNKQIPFCSNLPFGILLSLSNNADTESTSFFLI